MTSESVIDVSRLGRKKGGGGRGRPKGRQVDAHALEEVNELLGDAPRRRDLLIEFLHRIQDRYGCISAAHIVRAVQRAQGRRVQAVQGAPRAQEVR